MSVTAMKKLFALDLSGLSDVEHVLLRAFAAFHNEDDNRIIRSHAQLVEACGPLWNKMMVSRVIVQLEAHGLLIVLNRGQAHATKEAPSGKRVRGTAFEYQLTFV